VFYCPSCYCAQYKHTKTLEVPSATYVSGIPLNILITACIRMNFTFVLFTDWNIMSVDYMLRVAVMFFSSPNLLNWPSRRPNLLPNGC
jgi:sensor histidine kinase YesM